MRTIIGMLIFAFPVALLSPAPTSGGGCPATSVPYTDSFTPTGPLSGCWTQTTATPSGIASITQNSGFAVVANGNQGFAMFTGYAGYTLTGPRSVQASLTWNSGNYSGIGLMTVAGNGLLYIPNLNAIYGMASGSGTGVAVGCTTPSGSGDTVLLVTTQATGGSGSLITLTDVTTSTVLCTQTNYTANAGGLMVYPTVGIDERSAGTEKIGPMTFN